jgi:hypothetical protein
MIDLTIIASELAGFLFGFVLAFISMLCLLIALYKIKDLPPK